MPIPDSDIIFGVVEDKEQTIHKGLRYFGHILPHYPIFAC
jgi:hypothetical protein